MKGIVFTEFVEMVEDKFGIDTADAIISSANLPPKVRTRRWEPTTTKRWYS